MRAGGFSCFVVRSFVPLEEPSCILCVFWWWASLGPFFNDIYNAFTHPKKKKIISHHYMSILLYLILISKFLTSYLKKITDGSELV